MFSKLLDSYKVSWLYMLSASDVEFVYIWSYCSYSTCTLVWSLWLCCSLQKRVISKLKPSSFNVSYFICCWLYYYFLWMMNVLFKYKTWKWNDFSWRTGTFTTFSAHFNIDNRDNLNHYNHNMTFLHHFIPVWHQWDSNVSSSLKSRLPRGCEAVIHFIRALDLWTLKQPEIWRGLRMCVVRGAHGPSAFTSTFMYLFMRL